MFIITSPWEKSPRFGLKNATPDALMHSPGLTASGADSVSVVFLEF